MDNIRCAFIGMSFVKQSEEVQGKLSARALVADGLRPSA
jgi:hypothetical protein